MKKILSLFLVLAMAFSLCTTVAFADATNYFELKEVSNADGVVTLEVYCKTDATVTLTTLAFTIDMSEAVANGLDIENDVTVTAGTYVAGLAKSANHKTITFGNMQVMPALLGIGSIGTITIDTNNLTKDFDITATTSVSYTGDNNIYTDKFSMTEYTLKAGATPSVETADATFYAEALNPAGYTGVTFSFTSTANGDATYNVPFGIDVQNAEKVLVGLTVSAVPTTDTVTCVDADLYE